MVFFVEVLDQHKIIILHNEFAHTLVVNVVVDVIQTQVMYIRPDK